MKPIKYAKSVSQRVDRRRFVAGAGASLLLAPFFRYLSPTPALAQGGGPKRLLVMLTHGTHVDYWKPKGSTENEIKYTDWSPSLEQIRDRTVLIDGLNTTADHGTHNALNEVKFTSSIDQIAAKTLNLPHQSAMVVGRTSPDSRQDQSYFVRGPSLLNRGGKEVLNITTSVPGAFDWAFSDVKSGGGSGDTNPNARKLSMLDAVRGDIDHLRRALGAEEKAKLESHLSSLSAYEKSLRAAPMAGSCSVPGKPTELKGVQACMAHHDVIKNAFMCDVTRVASVFWGHSNSFQVNLTNEQLLGAPVDDKGNKISLEGELHGKYEHPKYGDPRFREFERWQAKYIADFVTDWGNTSDPVFDGSLLDNTLVVWARQMGNCHSHESYDYPLMLIGSRKLQFSPKGRYIDGETTRPYWDGLVTALHACGVPQADIKAKIDESNGVDIKKRPMSPDPIPGVLA